jgi:hypothetical protein
MKARRTWLRRNWGILPSRFHLLFVDERYRWRGERRAT